MDLALSNLERLICHKTQTIKQIDVLLWTLAHGHAGVGQLSKIYIHLFIVDTGCNL